MMKSSLILIFVIASCSCGAEFSARVRNFSTKLLHYTHKETNGPLVISPFGIWSLMTGMALGAAGNSKSQLFKALQLSYCKYDKFKNDYQNLTKTVADLTGEGVKLTYKNFMIIDQELPINPYFFEIISSDFGATVQKINFKNPALAANQANDLIKESGASSTDVFKSDNFLTSRMILTNVITFKGLWASPFNKSETALETFYDENNNKIGEVNMMHQTAQLRYSNMPTLKSLILELPYGNDDKYCMLVMLPHQKVKINDVYEKLQTISISEIFNQLENDINEFGFDDVEVKLPRFKLTTNMILNKPLNNMGVIDIFESDLANLKHITTEQIHVSSIIHKAYIEVTESGTEAAAETSAFFTNRQSSPGFVANRPFIYFVMEKTTETILFSGTYSEPSVF